MTAFGEAVSGVLARPELIPLVLSWGVALSVGALQLPEFVRRAPKDAAVFCGLVAAAVLLRLMVPWGPINFVEGERNSALWSNEFWSGRLPGLERFATLPVLLGSLRLIGIRALLIVRYFFPFLGALGVGAVYLLARAARLERWPATLGAAVLLMWPAHVRYSASSEFTPFAALVWTMVFAVAITESLVGLRRALLLTALIVLGVFTRPESRLLVAAVLPLLFTKHWSWTDRLQLGLLLMPALILYALGVGLQPGEARGLEFRALLMEHLRTLFTRSAMAPVWWLPVSLVALALGRISPSIRVACLVAMSALLLAFSLFGTEDNPLFGAWRYDLMLLPWVCLLSASLLARLMSGRTLLLRVIIPAAIVLLPMGAYGRLMMRPIDVQEQFRYLVETAPEMARGHEPMAIVEESENTTGTINVADMQLYGIGLGAGESASLSPCAHRVAITGTTAVVSLNDLLHDQACAGDSVRLFLGLSRPPATMALGSELKPLSAISLAVAPASPAVNSRCHSSSADCLVTMGWYGFTRAR